MSESLRKKDNSSSNNMKKYSPVLYRIHSQKRNQTNILLKKLIQDIISMDFFLKYKLLKEIPVWNQMREDTFQIIESEFLQTIIEKGLKKETHKEIIQNNYDDYQRFFQRKIRYLISELEFDARFDEFITKFNDELLKEILLNIETEKEKLVDLDYLSHFISRVNDQLSHSFVKFFSRKIAVFMTSHEPYRKLLLDYFTEFFHYLVVF